MINLNTNLSSQIVQQSMSNATKLLNLSVEQMTTGYKINHAKDNAANYSISTNMSTKISAYEVAESNTSMGLDMLTTAADSLSQIEDKLSRLRALQEQATNGTYGEKSLKAINKEVNALVDEIERLYSTIEYNGINVFRGQELNSETSSFINEVKRRDTSNMTKLSSVLDTEILNGTYSISTKEELIKLSEMTNAGKVAESADFVLSANIDLENIEWSPIGIFTASDDTLFRASFDGNGYIISNLNINNSSANPQGLFGFVSGASIQNVAVENASITSNAYIGVLVGCADMFTNIYNSYCINGEVLGEKYVGGLVGHLKNGSILKNSYTISNVSGKQYVSGLCAVVEGYNTYISGCYAKGEIANTQSNGEIGGLVAVLCQKTKVMDSYFIGSIDSIPYSYSSSGGLIGTMRGGSVVDGCYAILSNSYVSGGLVGACGFPLVDDIIIKNSYIGGQATCVRGILLGNLNTDTDAIIENCAYSSSLDLSIPLDGSSRATLRDIKSSQPDYVPFEILTNANVTNYSSRLSWQVGINSGEQSQISIDLDLLLGKIDFLRDIGLDTMTDYLTQIDEILSTVTAKQTEYGAAQNRLMSALEEIAVQRDNLISSRSTLRDADISEVSSQYIQQQILQEASATLLATANQTPSIALGLI